MKLKGFTLVELLAVIVVLAVIALISTPIITNVIDKAKLGSYKDTAYGVLEAANLYYAKNEGLDEVKEFTLENGKFVSGEETLQLKNNIKGNGTLIISTNGVTTLCMNNENIYTYKNYDTYTVVAGKGDTCKVEDNILINQYVTYLESNGSTINGYYTKEEVDNNFVSKEQYESIGTLELLLELNSNNTNEHQLSKSLENYKYVYMHLLTTSGQRTSQLIPVSILEYTKGYNLSFFWGTSSYFSLTTSFLNSNTFKIINSNTTSYSLTNLKIYGIK